MSFDKIVCEFVLCKGQLISTDATQGVTVWKSSRLSVQRQQRLRHAAPFLRRQLQQQGLQMVPVQDLAVMNMLQAQADLYKPVQNQTF